MRGIFLAACALIRARNDRRLGPEATRIPETKHHVTVMKSFLTFLHRRTFLVALLALPLAARAGNDSPGAIYSLSNEADANRVLVFARNAHGRLAPDGAFPTGGRGTGASLGSQGALALTGDGRWLLAVNAGSNELSVFAVRHDALVLSDIVSSGGLRPISVTVADNLVYVLNAGGAAGGVDNISGFYLTERGRLHALPGSTQPLSAADTAPAQISFARRGDVLIVAEKATSRIDSFVVDDTGRAGPGSFAPSSGATPFGFAVSSKSQLFVSEAVSSALTSYAIRADGTVSTITPSLINGQAAACWVALSKDEHYAYTANAASNSISGYRIARNGSLTLFDDNGLTAVAQKPLDLAVSGDGRFLYALNAGTQSISAYRIRPDGSLDDVGSVPGLSLGSAGLVAR
jgi:6-phosphogluconolactonase (cycloisomerase 2 family)